LERPALNASLLLVAMFAIGAVLPCLMLSAEVALRRSADERRRDSEQRLSLFIEHAPVSIAMFDRDMCYLAASKRALERFGLTQTPVGKCYYDVFEDIPDAWKAVHQRCLAGAVERSDGERLQRADGSVKWIGWEARPWRDGRGEICGVLISSEDITANMPKWRCARTKPSCGSARAGCVMQPTPRASPSPTSICSTIRSSWPKISRR
jgi:PAS domain S-box-containing protein